MQGCDLSQAQTALLVPLCFTLSYVLNGETTEVHLTLKVVPYLKLQHMVD